MRGPNEPIPTAELHPPQTGRRTGDSAPRARAEISNANTGGVALPRQYQKHEAMRDHKKTRYEFSEAANPQAAFESVAAEFQNALTDREKELDEERLKCSLLLHANNKAAETIKNQAQTIAQREADAKSLHDLLDTIVEGYLKPYALENGTHPDGWSRESVLEVMKALSTDASDAHVHTAEAMSYAADVHSLTEQVRTLQKEMLAKVEKVHVASDEQFAQDFRNIVSLIKTMSRTVHIVDTVDVAGTLGTGPLLEGVSGGHWAGRAKKKLLVEAWVWSVLLDNIFRTPFAIFGNQCDVLNSYWNNIYQPRHRNGWPKPTTLCETWRYTTVESMLERIDRNIIAHGKEVGEPNKLEVGVSTLRHETYNTIGSRLTKISSITVDAPQVQNIVDKAFKLALQMSLQRVRIQITHPKVGDSFSTDTMKAVPNTDGEDADDGAVAFIVHPGLTKWGDTHGKNLDHRYDIVPSLVQVADSSKPESVQTEPGLRVWANVVKHGLEKTSASDRKNQGESQR
ncbi:hypothetical protein PtrM4_124300 [Pyrenophora tritici-repentis]|uniref:Uncharacterized protein n=2 Tax=Pyrenophora tritici-repentis TaxID=45151 RepID=A0A2W1CYC4_9PLEO|nr:uncharacterized protein PTRG_09266 [Pyrenophora tritici-repentis Pt-1C-BFP]KAF7441818.1 hypothetical protein A1F99_136700 [Pyrenophora tritici-repentis]EDU42317.1 predicted protein [Pyrenophora tritici-repentis Pt-1C-BFP]KAF7567817.1 hypothetical protein PtrM4_124300 [Pyrenophora tritici-repentis]KAI0570079.1 hypothetical protein Alg215_11280 [Pyrenophora tritici-repentis]KAI1507920.1 hypothetical protein Ptr86124_013174 [Pyrenophora tritici-repentis]